MTVEKLKEDGISDNTEEDSAKKGWIQGWRKARLELNLAPSIGACTK